MHDKIQKGSTGTVVRCDVPRRRIILFWVYTLPEKPLVDESVSHTVFSLELGWHRLCGVLKPPFVPCTWWRISSLLRPLVLYLHSGLVQSWVFLGKGFQLKKILLLILHLHW
jgi:hypothetical protein